MDIFKFNQVPGRQATVLERGEIINGIKSILWIERYRGAGEFTLIAPVDSGLKDLLPIGSYISHIDSYEVMIVENHEINEDSLEETLITVTGRSLVSILENRIVGENVLPALPTTDPLPEYVIPLNSTWLNAMTLIDNHIKFDGYSIQTENVLENVSGMFTGGDGTGSLTEGPIKQGTVYDAVMELLETDDLGIKSVRPGPWTLIRVPAFTGEPYTELRIYWGFDRSNKVIFSYDLGDIEHADYVWSDKNFYTHALVRSKWAYSEVGISGPEGSEKRTMYIDASFVDNGYSDPPGTDLTDIIALIEAYGLNLLAAQRHVALVSVELSKERTRFHYRKDYSVGDIVRIEGNYDTNRLARVIEYVEIEDETGESGYPTLSLI